MSKKANFAWRHIWTTPYSYLAESNRGVLCKGEGEGGPSKGIWDDDKPLFSPLALWETNSLWRLIWLLVVYSSNSFLYIGFLFLSPVSPLRALFCDEQFSMSCYLFLVTAAASSSSCILFYPKESTEKLFCWRTNLKICSSCSIHYIERINNG